MSTVKDIALKSGFSTSTVSRVLNFDTSLSVSDETRKSIITCAEQMKYNFNKRNMKKNNNLNESKIGLVTFCSEQFESEDSYYLSIRLEIERELNRRGLNITRTIRWANKDSYESLIGLDGLVVIGKFEFDSTNEFFKTITNVVFVDYSLNENKFDSVVVDFEKATETAINHLLSLNYKSIGLIGAKDFINRFGSDTGINSVDIRHYSFEKIMKEKKMYKPEFVHIGNNFSVLTGYQLMKQAIEEKNIPEAFLISSDPMAIGAYRAIMEKGLQIPKDIAIVSIDDIEMSAFMHPTLTTVKVYTEQMGKAAVNLLIERIEGRDVPLKVIVPTKLIVRGSC